MTGISWIDVSIHFAIAAAVTSAGGFGAMEFGGPWVWYMALLAIAFFWVREAIQHMDRHGIDGNPAKALNPFRWGLGSQMEFYAPALAATLTALAWSIF